MPEIFQTLFDHHFIPHGHCYLWQPELVGLHLIGDILIAISYYSIPLALLYFVGKRGDIPFNRIFLLFSAFIVACGTTHLLSVWTLWYPIYWLSGVVKATTAGISLYTAIVLVFLLPKALTLPSLAATNQKLEAEIAERRRTESALAESEAKSRAILAAIPDLMFRVNGNGVYLGYVSSNQMIDLVPSSAHSVGKRMADILPPEIAQRQLNCIHQALSTGELQTYEQQVQIGDRLQDEEVRVIKSGEDEVLFIIRDVSKQQAAMRARDQAERALQQLNQELEARVEQRTAALWESEERWHLALQGSNDGIWDWNLKTNQMFFSSRWKTMRGFTEDDIGPDPEEWSSRIHPDDRDRVMQAVADHFAHQTPFYQEEYRVQRKDGTYIWVLDRGQALWDEAGKPVRMAGSESDITDRKQAEAQLRQNAAHLAAAQRIANLGSWEFDLKTQEVIWSAEVFRIFGRDPELGSPTYEEVNRSIHPDDRSYHQQVVQQAIVTPQSYELEFRAVRPDGSLRHLQARGEPILNPEGQLIRLVGTILDITDRKQAEEQLRQTNEQLALSNLDLARATRLKDEFLATMSHELRTPLNAVLGMSEGLQDGVFGPLNPRQLQAITIIEQSGQHLLDLINDILDLSKIEAGKLDLDLNDVSVQILCDTSLTFVQPMATKKRIHLSLHCPPHPGYIQADDRRLRQVLINLLSNAIKFTPEGGAVTLEVTRVSQQRDANNPDPLEPESPDYLCFSITDTGIGIAPENMYKLFQPFSQIDSSLNRQYSGTGLGLALVRRITELHQGDVTVRSKLGQGSCFTVQIPARVYPMAATISPSTPGQPRSPATIDLPDEPTIPMVTPVAPMPLILLAEDNPTNVQTLTQYLKALGYPLVLARDGQEAIALARLHHPNLILMDIQMPKMDGLKAIRRIRAELDQAQVPIIALTALAMPGDRERCLAAGANEYLTKPVKLKQLIALMQQLLGRRT
ncbi:hypothetical protein BST81_01540 [Leptolyngbya sp. 'hensonii']|uniref:PAS domain-containing protein n=1 Tax=Leptolyngbya sp. 'hensonii' TaxID=1922337 RepID=UPI00094F798B|nr:PAS domain-containing protein [Leptolyngbya sp. 'hensonii']OLP20144.1 hypothetical protein BST81_01540 [Leptolyngbya sp. 'hensonii']